MGHIELARDRIASCRQSADLLAIHVILRAHFEFVARKCRDQFSISTERVGLGALQNARPIPQASKDFPPPAWNIELSRKVDHLLLALFGDSRTGDRRLLAVIIERR